MDTYTLLVLADVFFFIITLCIIFLTVTFTIAGLQLIKILQNVRRISRNVRLFQIFIKNLISKI